MFGSNFAQQFGLFGPPWDDLSLQHPSNDAAAALSTGPLSRQLVQVSADRPYQNVPESLMGFRKSGPNKGFEEQRYPHTQSVEITFPSGDTITDEIKGMNKAHAIERAYRNWPGARIVPLETHGPMHEGGSGLLPPGLPMPLE